MLATVGAAALLSGGAALFGGGVAWAQSRGTPDTGSTIHGLSTGGGRGRTGAGQGQSGTTEQDLGGPANQEKATLGRGSGKLPGTPTTGVKAPSDQTSKVGGAQQPR
jgi:hypothetical protein